MASVTAQPSPSKTVPDQLAAPNRASKRYSCPALNLGRASQRRISLKYIVRRLPCSSLPLSNSANGFKSEAGPMDGREVFEIHRIELRASGSHKDTVVCHSAARVPHVLQKSQTRALKQYFFCNVYYA